MGDLRERLETAEAEVAALKRQIAGASCQEVGHDWQFYGGKNAGCCDWCDCSVPVYRCSKCGDFDYGENDEAEQIRRECADTRREWAEGRQP